MGGREEFLDKCLLSCFKEATRKEGRKIRKVGLITGESTLERFRKRARAHTREKFPGKNSD